MAKKIKKLWIVCILLIPCGLLGQKDDNLSLSLKECILKTVHNNLGLAVERITPQIADANVKYANEKFIPTLSMDYSKQDSNSASYSFLDASETVSTLSNNYSTQITQIIPTGGNFSLSLNGYMSDTSRRFQTINPRYGTTLRFSFSQPLLKDFGYQISRRNIIIAKNNSYISDENFRRSLEETIYQAVNAYWNLFYSIENLKVRQQSLRLAQELLEKNKAEIDAGTLPPIEILTAQADVATREADILEAQAMVKNNEDLLKTIINLNKELPNSALIVIDPTDSPSVQKEDHRLEKALQLAMENRPELQATRIELENMEFNLRYARNQLSPDLRFEGSYWSPGVSGNQILYENGNALTGNIIGTIPGGGVDALKDSFNFKYKNWSVALTLSYPLSNIFSRGFVTQAKLNREQTELKLKDQEQQIFLEVKTAVRAVQTNYQRVQAYKAARELAQKKLEAEEEKFKVGLSTNYFILQYQRDLADAQIMELRAMVDYNISLANLYRVQGTGIDAQNIDIEYN
ncbi:MAG: TolC family protein [Candidatus Aminicenantes bacterium]